jgi:hypothetical protein
LSLAAQQVFLCYVKPKMHHITILHHILLTFYPEFRLP